MSPSKEARSTSPSPSRRGSVRSGAGWPISGEVVSPGSTPNREAKATATTATSASTATTTQINRFALVRPRAGAGQPQVPPERANSSALLHLRSHLGGQIGKCQHPLERRHCRFVVPQAAKLDQAEEEAALAIGGVKLDCPLDAVHGEFRLSAPIAHPTHPPQGAAASPAAGSFSNTIR